MRPQEDGRNEKMAKLITSMLCEMRKRSSQFISIEMSIVFRCRCHRRVPCAHTIPLYPIEPRAVYEMGARELRNGRSPRSSPAAHHRSF